MSRGPVVVIILSHRDPPLVRRLVRRLGQGTNTVAVVHHDPRGPDLGLPRSETVLEIPDARPADWGRMSLAHAMLKGLEFAAAKVPDLSWALLISGQDYPCRPVQAIEADLAAASSDAFLRHFRVDPRPGGDVHPWQALTRRRYLRRMRLPGMRRSVPFPRRHPFTGDMHLYVGDMWVNLGASAVAHVLEQRRRLARVERYLSRCSVPDEALLPSLLLNHAEHLDVVNDRRRYIRWHEGRAHPEFLVPADAATASSGTDFFARKVDCQGAAQVLDLFDELAAQQLGGRS